MSTRLDGNGAEEELFQTGSLEQNPSYLEHLNLDRSGVRPLFVGPLPDLTGKTALVTGGGTGIGNGIVCQLVRAGATVVQHYCLEEQEVARTQQMLAAEQREGRCRGELISLQADFKKGGEIESLYSEALKRTGSIHLLVNNAGITSNKPHDEWSLDDIEDLFRVNVHAPILLTKLAASHMRENRIRGEVVNFSSPHAHFSMAGHSLYGATKAAVEKFSEAMAIDLADPDVGIRVVCIIPGWVLVKNHFEVTSGELLFAKGGLGIPQGRQSTPEEIGTFVAQLGAGMHPYFVGTVTLDGGQMLRWNRADPLPEAPNPDRFGAKYLR